MAVVASFDGDRVSKYARFDTRDGAEAHAREYGGTVYDEPRGDWNEWRLDNGSLIYDPPTPPRKSVLTYADFRARFTEQEMAAVRVAVTQDAEALDWALGAAADNAINLDSARTSAFLDKMVGAGIITTDRKAQILA